jgi:prolyl oligopeptidase
MKKIFLSMALIAVANSFGQTVLNYPKTKTTETVEVYFDSKIIDPYRWLEDDKSAETAEWVQAKNKVRYYCFFKYI